jgi:hypothetical protein
MRETCLISSIATVVILVGTSQSIASIVSGPISFGGHDYYVLSKNTWTASEAEAVTLGGHLVAINDLLEDQFILNSIILGQGHDTDPLWIGLSDAASENTFVWSNGDPPPGPPGPPGYDNWKPNEPNNYNGDEDYVAINWEYARNGGSRGWNDAPVGGSVGFGGTSDGPYYGIAEVSTGAVPEATSFLIWGLLGLTVARCGSRRRQAESRMACTGS